MNYLFTSESVSEGHPDKVADQISDAVLDQILAFDPQSRVACETLVTTGQVVIAGEIKSRTQLYANIDNVVRGVIKRIGYNKSEYKFDADSCGIFSALHAQSPDINRGVDRDDQEMQGAGDQGMMFGYASSETSRYMPLTLDLSHLILKTLAEIRREGKEMTYLRPDSKSQVTVEYDFTTHKPVRIHTIVVSTQHDDFIKPENDSPEAQLAADKRMIEIIREDVKNILLPRVKECLTEQLQALFDDKLILFVNPTGKFVIGGPYGDTGLTGRKIIVDTYGGRGAHGGGAFSGKDPSKVDRSAAYAARHIAKNAVAAGIADELLVQVAYAIGEPEPVSFYVNTYGTAKVNLTDGEIADKLHKIFKMTPFEIEKRLKLRNPIYEETASYGHIGREPKTVVKRFESQTEGVKTMEVELFTWEKLDYVETIKKSFNI